MTTLWGGMGLPHMPFNSHVEQSIVNWWWLAVSTCQYLSILFKNKVSHEEPYMAGTTLGCFPSFLALKHAETMGVGPLLCRWCDGKQSVNTKLSHQNIQHKDGGVSDKNAVSTSWTCFHQSSSYALHFLFAGENQLKIRPNNSETMLRKNNVATQ